MAEEIFYSALHWAKKAEKDANRATVSSANAEEAKNLANEAVTKLGEFDSTVDNAKAEIASLSATEQAVIVSAASGAKEVAVTEINNSKTSALTEINTTKDTAVNEVEQAGETISSFQFPIIPISQTSGSVSVSTNTIYQMSINGATTFVLPSSVNTGVFNQIKVMAMITGTPTIDWGTTRFFDKKTPIIEGGSYDIYFDYDNLLGAWVCGAMDKG